MPPPEQPDPQSPTLRLRVIVTACGLLAAIAHMIVPRFIPDGITAGFLLIAIVPWLSDFVKNIEISGVGKFEFQEVQRKQEILQADVDALRFLVSGFVTDWELTHLTKLNGPEPFPYTWGGKDDDRFIHELRRLRDLGLIDRDSKLEGLRKLPIKGDDLKSFVHITDRGKTYLVLRAQLVSSQKVA